LRSGAKFVYYPTSLLLIASATTAFAALAVCTVVMLRNRDNTYGNFAQLVPLTVVGLLIAVSILLMMSGGRFWIERTFGLAAPA
jgi:hypothetical protein